MKNEDKPQNEATNTFQAHRFLSLAVFFTTLWVIFLKMLFEPTFFDGITYGAVAQNLATQPQGFWLLTYTETIFPTFVEHPPLFLWLLHLTFLLPPLPFPPELCLNFVLLFCVLILIQKIWFAAQTKTKPDLSAWIPLSFFLITPVLRESYSSSLIDNLICAFNLLTVLLLLNCKAASPKKVLRTCILVGIITFLGILSKGPVGLYPLLPCIVMPFFFSNPALRRYGSWVPLIVCLSLLGALCLYDDAYRYLSEYFHKQVLASLIGTRSTATFAEWGHLYLLKRLLTRDLLPLIFLGGTCVLIYRYRRQWPDKKNITNVLFFLVLGTLGILPLLITAKQWPFYNVPALPFFILTVAFIVKDLFEAICHHLYHKRILWNLGILSFCLSIGLWTSHKSQQLQKEGAYWEQWYAFFETVPENITFTTCSDLKRDFSLHAYAKRFGRINLFLEEGSSEFHISNASCEKPKNATLLSKGPHGYELWVRQNTKP